MQGEFFSCQLSTSFPSFVNMFSNFTFQQNISLNFCSQWIRERREIHWNVSRDLTEWPKVENGATEHAWQTIDYGEWTFVPHLKWNAKCQPCYVTWPNIVFPSKITVLIALPKHFFLLLFAESNGEWAVARWIIQHAGDRWLDYCGDSQQCRQKVSLLKHQRNKEKRQNAQNMKANVDNDSNKKILFSQTTKQNIHRFAFTECNGQQNEENDQEKEKRRQQQEKMLFQQQQQRQGCLVC